MIYLRGKIGTHSEYPHLITITVCNPPNFYKYIAGNIYSRIINPQLSTPHIINA